MFDFPKVLRIGFLFPLAILIQGIQRRGWYRGRGRRLER